MIARNGPVVRLNHGIELIYSAHLDLLRFSGSRPVLPLNMVHAVSRQKPLFPCKAAISQCRFSRCRLRVNSEAAGCPKKGRSDSALRHLYGMDSRE
jgi:hypothetical protein